MWPQEATLFDWLDWLTVLYSWQCILLGHCIGEYSQYCTELRVGRPQSRECWIPVLVYRTGTGTVVPTHGNKRTNADPWIGASGPHNLKKHTSVLVTLPGQLWVYPTAATPLLNPVFVRPNTSSFTQLTLSLLPMTPERMDECRAFITL